jgi:hypothetical protein
VLTYDWTKNGGQVKLNLDPASSLHDMRVSYDPAIGGNYDARSGGQAARQQVRVSMLAVALWAVTRAKDLYNTGAHSFRQQLKRRACLLKRIKPVVQHWVFGLNRGWWLTGLCL